MDESFAPLVGEAAVIARTKAPVTGASMTDALHAAGVQAGGVVIVHSSLSRLGWVVGGAHTGVLALGDAVVAHALGTGSLNHLWCAGHC